MIGWEKIISQSPNAKRLSQAQTCPYINFQPEGNFPKKKS
jgi:hypothetical protein